tara:strand:+ start:746 stop:1360 length:615 start_codon:yes stop_codon:yes gene_type:complete
VSAQDHGPDVILTTEGKYVEGIYVYEDSDLIILGRKNKLGVKRLIIFDKDYDIYSLNRWNQSERIIYKQDFKIGNVFTPDQMKLNIDGIMDAKERYNGKWVFIGSYLTGLSTVVLQTYDYKQNQLFTGRPPTTVQFLVPLGVTITVDLFPQRIKPRNVDIDYYEDPYYEAGYRYQRNGKRRVNAAAGSFLGIATGIVTYFIVNK